MLNLFESHIWSQLEYHNGALILAALSETSRIDSMQRGFLQELNLNGEEALINFNFVPLNLRRKIGLLGFIHKRILIEWHPSLMILLPNLSSGVNLPRYMHSRCIESNTDQANSRMHLFHRSLYLYIKMYNRLPPELVASTSVSCLQTKLTHLAKDRAKSQDPS